MGIMNSMYYAKWYIYPDVECVATGKRKVKNKKIFKSLIISFLNWFKN
jgi:hypothetical protein